MYGANGHGKSNFVQSLAILKKAVCEKHTTFNTFKLDPTACDKPSRFTIEFRYRGSDYEYGLVRSASHIAEEWLFVTRGRGQEKKIFERLTDLKDGEFKTTIEVGKLLRDEPSPSKKVNMETYIEVLSTGIDPTDTFLAEGHAKKIAPLHDAFHWFSSVLTPVSANSQYVRLHERAGTEEEFLRTLEQFMSTADVGIEDIKLVETPLDSIPRDQLPEGLADELDDLEDTKQIEVGTPDGRSYVIDHNDSGKLVKRELIAHRRSCDGELVLFHADEESSGTRRLIELAPMLADADDERVYVVDELDRKLHPLLAYQLVEAFFKRGAGQLIFTTHNTYLMSLDLLRRDEIYFIQKKENGSSELYSLADLKVRPDLDIRKGYLHGRFGAIPFLGNLSDLGWQQDSSGTLGAN
jgi:hypothetical protein